MCMCILLACLSLAKFKITLSLLILPKIIISLFFLSSCIFLLLLFNAFSSLATWNPGGVLPYKRLMGMCCWMGSHFHDWMDYNGVTFLVELLEWGCTFSAFLG